MESADLPRGRGSTSRRAPRHDTTGQKTLSVLLGIAFLLVLCGLAAGAGTLLSSRAARTSFGGSNRPAGQASPDRLHPPRQARQLHLPRGHNAAAPTWVWVVFLGALVAAALVVTIIVLRDRLAAGDETEPVEVADFPPQHERVSLQAGVAAALSDLDEEANARDGVVACWLRLEASLQDLHAERAPAETSLELAQRVLGAYDVDPATLYGLQRSYQTARYSRETVTEAMRDRARSALQVVSRQLSRTRATPEPPTMSPAGS